MTQQLVQSLQVATQELLVQKTTTPAATTPFPDPGREAQHLLPHLTPENNIEAYLECFEQVAHREDWGTEEWPHILWLLLSGEARTAYYALSLEEAADYGEV